MPCRDFEENFGPHRRLVDGRMVIKPHLRVLYPYHIEKPRHPDMDQDEHPQETIPVDVSKIKQWLEKCNGIHGDHCRGNHPTGTQVGRPSFLIDVKRMCLVPADDHPYLALSYVWGSASCVSLSSQTREYLQEEGSLRQEQLPQTIKQSLELVAQLGEPHYLWVDRLCIDQHDGSTKKGQIAAMANIYANSYLTIIAAENDDASKPLCPRGFMDLSSLEQAESNNNQEGHHRPCSPTSPRSSVMEDLSWSLVTSSTWSTRGWTFQEYYSSRRKLIFHRNTVTWECHCEAWNEMDDLDQCIANTRQCQAIPRSPNTSTLNSTGLQLSSWPDFHLFTRLICLFNVRHLTYQSDALDAMEGLLSVFGTVFKGGFISGLPQMIFDAALTWQPYFPMERRSEYKFEDPRIPPSWSYFGHYGSVHSEDLVAACNYIIHEDLAMRLPATHTISTVEWSHSVSYDGPRTQIKVSGNGYREKYQGKHEDLPPGWHAMETSTNYLPYSPRRRSSINSDLVHYYWHDGVGDSTQRFWYPVPICSRSPTSTSQPGPSHRPRFLHGNTRVLMGAEIVLLQPQLQRRLGKEGNPRRCADAFIRLRCMGKWIVIGYMRLNQSVDSFPGHEEETGEEIVVGQNCTLIELSRGSTTYDERLLDRYVEYLYPAMVREKVVPTGKDEVYEFVNVMWIETVDGGGGIAKRKAVGRVVKGDWGRFAMDGFDVSLC